MNSKITNFKDLIIWQDSVALVEEIYKLTKVFPSEERFFLVSQLQRSAISIPSNIAEGFMRSHNKEYKQFLFIALGSCAELETQVTIAKRIGYVNEDASISIFSKIDKINRMTMSLIKKL